MTASPFLSIKNQFLKHAVRRLLLSLTIAVLLLPAAPALAQVAPAGPVDAYEVGAFFDGLMASQIRDNHIPGAVIVVVKDGEVFFSKGYGWADVEARVPVDPETTLFRPGSVSKLFTWTAVMQLVEQGKLLLDEDINAYLDFKIPATFPEPITIRHLMTHTPGFEDQGDGLFKLNPGDVVSLETYVKQRVPARIFPPGTVGAYSNYGTALAGYIIERISGLPFYEYAEKFIFEPLGMESATYRQPLPEGFAPRMAAGYNYIDGKFVRGGFEYVVPYPVGGLSASGLAMAKFMIAHLQDGRYGNEQILGPETARQMRTQLFTHDPRLTGMAYGFFESRINGEQVFSHGGDTILFHTGLYLIPERNTGLFISTNGTSGPAAVEAVFTAFMDRYYPALEVPLQAAPDFASRAGLYAGEYYAARNSFTTFEKILRLTQPVLVQVDGQEVVVKTNLIKRFIEVEPGLLVDRDDPDNKLVMKMVDGQVYLYPSVPFAFIKTDAAGSASLHLLIFAGGALLSLIALLKWGSALLSRRNRQAQSPSQLAARWVGALFALSYLAFLGVIIVLFTNIDPAYGVPKLFFGLPDWFRLVDIILPVIIALLALAMVIFSVLLWARRSGSRRSRLFYSLLSLSAAAIVWAMVYWNLL